LVPEPVAVDDGEEDELLVVGGVNELTPAPVVDVVAPTPTDVLTGFALHLVPG